MFHGKAILYSAAVLTVAGIWYFSRKTIPDSAGAGEWGFNMDNARVASRSMSGGSVDPVGPRIARTRNPDSKLSAADTMAEQLLILANDEHNQLSLELMEELARFDSPQLQRVISAVTSSPDLTAIPKAEAIGFLLPVLARIDPATALDLRVSLGALFKDQEDILPLSKLLETVEVSDPAIANEWREKHPASRD